MLNVIRRSQMIGLTTMDRNTAKGYGKVEEVWVDPSGRVAYVSSDEGYFPIDEVATVGSDGVLTYSFTGINSPNDPLNQLNRMAVRTQRGHDPIGWIEDFLFDWETGDIVAYVLGGDIATPFGGRAVLFPDDVKTIDADVVVIKDEAKDRLKTEKEGLQGFLSEKSQQVRNAVKQILSRAQSLISPDDSPETVRVKVKQVSDELSASGKHDKNAVQEATEFLQDQWQDLQNRVTRAGNRMKKALDKAWKRLTNQR